MKQNIAGYWKSFIRTHWSSAWFLALFFTLPFLWLLPGESVKYKAEVVRSGVIDKPGGYEYYPDLNGDGTSERVIYFENTEGRASVKILDAEGYIKGQFYFAGQMLRERETFITGAVDRSGKKEIFVITRSQDSLLLHAISPSTGQPLFRDVLITTLPPGTTKKDLTTSLYGLYDLNGDGSVEILLSVMAGFTLQPRAIFAYDMKKNEMKRTPCMGAFFRISRVQDINGDGSPEILTGSYAISNHPDTSRILYHDSTAWLLVFDAGLKPLFPPQSFRGRYSYLFLDCLGTGDSVSLVGLSYSLTRGVNAPRVLLFDSRGQTVRERKLKQEKGVLNYNLFIPHGNPDHFYISRVGEKIEKVDRQLRSIGEIDISEAAPSFHSLMDLEADQDPEIICYNDQHVFRIMQSDFSHPIDIGIYSNSPLFLDLQNNSNKLPLLFCQTGDSYSLVSYGVNPWYYLRYPGILVVFLIGTGFIFLIQFVQREKMKQRYESERKMAAMQLQMVKNQLDPHFTFNAMNTISSAILNQSTKEAYEILMRLSRLIRSCVDQSERLSRTLAEELDFVNNYLQLASQKFHHNFHYSIDIAEEVDLNWHVPRMMIQIHAENALKHGISPMEKGGRLMIRASVAGKFLRLEIEDNGIGREAAKKHRNGGTGKGQALMEQFFHVYNRFSDYKIEEEIVDLKDQQQNPAGTMVRIIVPAGMKIDWN